MFYYMNEMLYFCKKRGFGENPVGQASVSAKEVMQVWSIAIDRLVEPFKLKFETRIRIPICREIICSSCI
jgi:hypothetical protein